MNEHLLDEGLVFADIPFVKWKKGKPTFGNKQLGIITSNSCACEDYERATEKGQTSKAERIFLQVAPLRSAKVFGDNVEMIKAGSHLDYFFVKGEGSRLADQVVDFTQEQGIPASVLVDCTKVALIADWQWKALLIHLGVSRFHQQPEKLFLKSLLESGSDAA